MPTGKTEPLPRGLASTTLPVREMGTNGPPAKVPLTEEVIEQLCSIVANGNFRYIARQDVGIPEDTFRAWVKAGRKEIRDYFAGKAEAVTLRAVLVQRLEQVESKVHQDIIRDVLLSENVNAKIWYLERRWNKLYSKNPNTQIDDESGEEIKVDPLELLRDKLKGLLDE